MTALHAYYSSFPVRENWRFKSSQVLWVRPTVYRIKLPVHFVRHQTYPAEFNKKNVTKTRWRKNKFLIIENSLNLFLKPWLFCSLLLSQVKWLLVMKNTKWQKLVTHTTLFKCDWPSGPSPRTTWEVTSAFRKIQSETLREISAFMVNKMLWISRLFISICQNTLGVFEFVLYYLNYPTTTF